MITTKPLGIISVARQKPNAVTKQNAMIQQVLLRCQTNAALAATATAEQQDIAADWQSARPFKQMPTVTQWGMLRKLLPGGKYHGLDTTELFLNIRRDYGDIFLWPAMLGKKAMVVTHNPDDFEMIYRNEGAWPKRPGNEAMAYYRSELRKDVFQGIEGLITSQGEKWGKFRCAVNPVLMQPKTIKMYLPKMSSVNMQFLKRIREIRNPTTFEVPANFEEEINLWTFESVSIVALDRQLGLLGKNRNDPMVRRFFQNLTEFIDVSGKLEFSPSIWRYIPTPTFKRQMALLDELQDITTKYIEESKQRLALERANGVPEQPEKEQSVFEKLLKLDERIARVMAIDMMLAGVDTTTSTFTGALLCLSKNPEKQAKLREEIYRILPNKDSEFTEASVRNMPYLRAVIRESMRTYPLTLGNGRLVQNDVILSGYQVPKDTGILMVSVGLVKEEKHYPRASEYLPERWLRCDKEAANSASSAELKPSGHFIYLPFGFGPRTCIGRRVVEMELELAIARIIRNFYVEFNHPMEKPFKSLFVNVPNIPLQFTFKDVEK